jgi:hypothetical protein
VAFSFREVDTTHPKLLISKGGSLSLVHSQDFKVGE